jgi:tetratricopeptide (TPR) repeat protein
VDSPALFGLFQARLLIPKRWKGRFSREEWRHIFLHECAHIRRLDLPLNGLAAAAHVLHWFNPLVWWGLHRMRVERELACDALALAHGREADPRSYGATMIKLLEQYNRPAALPGLVGILEETSQIKQRIHMITQFRKPSRWSALSAAPLLLLALVCLTDARTGRGGTEVIPLLEDSSDAEAGEAGLLFAGESTASADSEPSPGGHLKDRMNPAALLGDARLLLEMGKLKEAAEVLNKIVEADSDHQPALYYLKMIKERQASLSARPRPPARTVSPSRAARARILHKLDQIVVAKIAYEDAPLKEVARDLNEKARQGDPEGRGIHFIINPHFDMPREGHQLPIDSQPLAPTAEDTDLHMVPIRLNLTDVRLLDVLDAIIQVAEERITYSIADSAVVFARWAPPVQVLHTRTFKVDPDKFLQGLESLGTPLGPDLSASEIILNFFTAAGIDFAGVDLASPLGGARKALFYNDRTGVILARATLEELEIMEKAILLMRKLGGP